MIDMLDPVQEPIQVRHGLTTRLPDLNGKVLGLYNNGKLNSVPLLELIASDLAREFCFTIRRGHYHASGLMKDADWGDVDCCDAVILANGDCGACSSSGIANAISLEKRGIPTLLVSTPPFFDAVATMARLNGMASIQWAVVAHPIGSVEESELRPRASAAAEQFRQIILRCAPGAPVADPHLVAAS